MSSIFLISLVRGSRLYKFAHSLYNRLLYIQQILIILLYEHYIHNTTKLSLLSDLAKTFMKPTHSSHMPLWLSLILTLSMVIIVRETAVVLCQLAGIEKAANIVGLLAMFSILMVWRLVKGLPGWLTQASNTLLVDSGFAFLPVSAGAGLLLFALGDELWGVMITMLISTLIPMWGLALLANRWLNSRDHNAHSDHTPINEQKGQP